MAAGGEASSPRNELRAVLTSPLASAAVPRAEPLPPSSSDDTQYRSLSSMGSGDAARAPSPPPAPASVASRGIARRGARKLVRPSRTAPLPPPPPPLPTGDEKLPPWLDMLTNESRVTSDRDDAGSRSNDEGSPAAAVVPAAAATAAVPSAVPPSGTGAAGAATAPPAMPPPPAAAAGTSRRLLRTGGPRAMPPPRLPRRSAGGAGCRAGIAGDVEPTSLALAVGGEAPG